MTRENHTRLYRALTARDPRFDGMFFVGVTSRAFIAARFVRRKRPRKPTAGFSIVHRKPNRKVFVRACDAVLNWRPAARRWTIPQRIAHLMVQRIEEGAMDDDAGLEAIADQFELSSRQIRRIIKKELGVSPIQLILTRRLLLAKQLLTETGLPVTEIAFASGFSSLRRFNDAFGSRYGMPPSRLRKKAVDDAGALTGSDTSTLQLPIGCHTIGRACWLF